MNRKTLMILATLGIAASGNAFAMEAFDSDGDGKISLEEMQAAAPSVTEDDFATLDANGDGMVDQDEYYAAEQAGTLPKLTDG